jgi:CubicO group peptidase (beta-lactamase class C family)
VNRAERFVLEQLGDKWKGATPGLCVQAYSRGRKVVDLEVGKTYSVYDLASLTKIVFSAATFIDFHDEKLFKVSDRVSRWVPWFPKEAPHRLKDLLSHTAGLTWWYPFYKEVAKKTTSQTSPEEAWEIFQAVLKRKVLADLRRTGTELRKEKAVYSDLDLFMLGRAMEEIAQTSLYNCWAGTRDRLGLHDTDFLRGNKPRLAKSKYAPTEEDQAWRGQVMQGAVHDENTFALKGVAPHAGLFGTLNDLSRFGLHLRKGMRGEKSALGSPASVQLFTKRSIPRARGDWALGFMMPTKGGASCGPRFSLDSVGHTGFTGTSLWYDPKQDLLVSLLSNRVHPTRENKAFIELRPQLHSWIAESLTL